MIRCTLAIKPRAQVSRFAYTRTIVQCSSHHSGPGTCVACRTPSQLSSPCGLPWPSSCVGRRAPQRDCHSNSAPTSTSRRKVFFLLVCRDRRPRKTVRHTFLQQLGSTLGRSTCLQHVPVRIAPAHIRPSCDRSTGSYRHSLVRCMANHRVPTISITLNQCARRCCQVAHARHLEVVVMMEMEMESHGSVRIMKRQSQHETTGQSLWRVPLSARSELHSQPLGTSSSLRAPHKDGRAGGPDGTYRD